MDFFNGHGSLESEYLAVCLADDVPLVLPGIVLAEILAGLKSEARARTMAPLLDAFETAPEPTPDDYKAAAAIFRSCRQAGGGIGSVVDCVIAQTCLRNDFTLLTKDRDFRRIAARTRLRLVEFS